MPEQAIDAVGMEKRKIALLVEIRDQLVELNKQVRGEENDAEDTDGLHSQDG